jgi:hypothetical protein
MNEYIKAVLVEAGDKITFAAASASASLVAARKSLRNGVGRVMKDIEKWLVNMTATPNERRMMHHRKKRIRRKYYNRVKRRVME